MVDLKDPGAQDIINSLKPIIQQAKYLDMCLKCAYDGLLFTPEELEAALARGQFVWGPVNWKLVKPSPYVWNSTKSKPRPGDNTLVWICALGEPEIARWKKKEGKFYDSTGKYQLDYVDNEITHWRCVEIPEGPSNVQLRVWDKTPWPEDR